MKSKMKNRNRDYCECLQIEVQPKIGWFERILMKVFTHFDIIKKVHEQSDTSVFLYLRRFYLWRSRWIGKNWGDLYLHKIVRSDDDPDPHTHPWWFITVVLKGMYRNEYWGWLPNGWVPPRARFNSEDELLKAPAIRFRDRTHIHRVRLDDQNSKPVWTLVLTGPYHLDQNGDADWAFVTQTRKVPWREYLNIPSGEHGG